MLTFLRFHAPIDMPAGATPFDLTYMASLAFCHPSGNEIVSRTGVGPAGTSSVAPASMATAAKVGCGVAAGLRSGTPNVGSAVVAAVGSVEDVTASAADGPGARPAGGAVVAGSSCLATRATANTATAARAIAAGALRLG